jgi:hypothetical protein
MKARNRENCHFFFTGLPAYAGTLRGYLPEKYGDVMRISALDLLLAIGTFHTPAIL